MKHFERCEAFAAAAKLLQLDQFQWQTCRRQRRSSLFPSLVPASTETNATVCGTLVLFVFASACEI